MHADTFGLLDLFESEAVAPVGGSILEQTGEESEFRSGRLWSDRF